MRRYGVLLVVLSLVAGCGGGSKRAGPQETHAPPAPLTRPPRPKPKPKPKPKPSWVRVIVQDGDLSTRVPHAVVHVMGRRGRTNRHGVARILLPHRGRLVTTVEEEGLRPLQA